MLLRPGPGPCGVDCRLPAEALGLWVRRVVHVKARIYLATDVCRPVCVNAIIYTLSLVVGLHVAVNSNAPLIFPQLLWLFFPCQIGKMVSVFSLYVASGISGDKVANFFFSTQPESYMF